MLPDKGVVLDIGANIGIMTASAARKSGDLKVIAFEPVPKNAQALLKIVRFFNLKNVTLHQVALGDQNGTVKMVMPVQNKVRFQGLSHVLHESITENNEGEIIDVAVYKLDDFEPLKNLNETIVGIKMDVENFEHFVVKGGLQLIKKNKPVLYIELWENENRTSCFSDLASIGYTPHTIENNKLVPFNAAVHTNHNFFFIASA